MSKKEKDPAGSDSEPKKPDQIKGPYDRGVARQAPATGELHGDVRKKIYPPKSAAEV